MDESWLLSINSVINENDAFHHSYNKHIIRISLDPLYCVKYIDLFCI